MGLSSLLLAAFLILFGLNALGLIAVSATVSATVLGIVALIAGILFLVEGYHPITIWPRNQA